MKIVILGLSLSSSWGNGHATTYRALVSGLHELGHEVLFLERNKPWYADHRDLDNPHYCRLEFYDSVSQLADWRNELSQADAVIVGSYVPDGPEVADYVLSASRGLTCFYDIDTPVTLAALARDACEFLRRDQIGRFDIYFSFAGGPTLQRIEQEFGARRAVALPCAVNLGAYRPLPLKKRWDLSYLGTYSSDRQPTLEKLLLHVARDNPDRSFAVAGPGYPASVRWPDNVDRIDHVPPADHSAFYSQSRFTLNVTRADMIEAGWSPSVRLFEAAACGSAIISDRWNGIEEFLTPGRSILLADSSEDVAHYLGLSPAPLGIAARRRVEMEHSSVARAKQLAEALCRNPQSKELAPS